VSTYIGRLVGGKVGYDLIGPRIDFGAGYGQIPSNAFVPVRVLRGGGGQLNVMAKGAPARRPVVFFCASTSTGVA